MFQHVRKEPVCVFVLICAVCFYFYVRTGATVDLTTIDFAGDSLNYTKPTVGPVVIGLRPNMSRKGTAVVIGAQKHTQDVFGAQKHTQETRLRVIRQACSDPAVFTSTTYQGNNQTRYYYSSTYNFTYCKVPKSGSTFWTQAFELFKHGPEKVDRIFNQLRLNVHKHSHEFLVGFKSRQCRQSPAVLISRDPYSRLFSAYIDKIYLPLMFNLNGRITQQYSKANKCAMKPTFQDFLDYIVRQTLARKTLNPHWAPIVSLCRPCNVNATVLVKQETFVDDVKYVLDVFGIQVDERRILLQALNTSRRNYTIPGIVGTVFSIAQNNGAMHCLTGMQISKLLWKSFQIQGYIKDTVSFPTSIPLASFRLESDFTRVVLETMRENPMTSVEEKRQRRTALVHAYREIRNKTLQQIKEIYRADFQVYGYSDEPPLNM